MRVTLPGGEGFDARSEETLLASAQRAHWLIRFGCRNGNCGACEAQLLQGRIDVRGESLAAPQTFLLCLAHAHSDLQIALPSDPLHGSAAHARRAYAQLLSMQSAGDGRWRAVFTLPAGRQPPLHAGQHVQIDSEPAQIGVLDDVPLAGRELTVFTNVPLTLAIGERVHLRYPLGFAYAPDAARPLWLLCDTVMQTRAQSLLHLWPHAQLVVSNVWPIAARAPAIFAYADDLAAVADWYAQLLAARVPFTEMRSDFAVWRPWRVCRQDDNANRFVIADFLDEASARTHAGEFTARGHKQLYWAEPMTDF